MMKKTLLTLVILALFVPNIAFGAFAVGWNASSTSQGWIWPNLVNGVSQTAAAYRFVASFFTATSTATSTFPAASIGNGIFNFLPSGKLTAGSGCVPGFTEFVTLCKSGDILVFGNGTSDLSAMLASDVNGNEVGLLTVDDAAIAMKIEGGATDSYGYGGYTATNFGALRIDKATGDAYFIEKLGIGTSSPYAKLSVVGQTVSAYFTATTTTASTFPVANITKLSNLTSNGFVKTSGGDGTLSVDTTTYESGLTAGDALTRTGNDFDFDGGATPSGDLGGTWASPSVTDDSHAHTSTTISGLDISADTNLAVTFPITLSNDTIGFGGLSTSTALANNNVVYATGVNTVGSESAFTYVSSTDLLTVVNASTTDFTIANVVKVPYETLSFNYGTSTWVGTTTKRLAPAAGAMTIQSITCETNAGTVGVSLYDGTNRLDYIPTASTTINTFVYSTNNTFTKNESIRVDIGTPASSPREVACRAKFIYLNDL